jgi:hypothetical protein
MPKSGARSAGSQAAKAVGRKTSGARGTRATQAIGKKTRGRNTVAGPRAKATAAKGSGVGSFMKKGKGR